MHDYLNDRAGRYVRCTRAERDEVAEELARHYEAGSLDDEEFQKRLDKAMAATYRVDFRCIVVDLPDLPAGARKPMSARALQNWAAFIAACAVFPLGALDGGSLFVVPLLVTCVINSALGFRASQRMGVVGMVSGLLYFPGTAVMIWLTREKS
jgi:hypothetical protein